MEHLVVGGAVSGTATAWTAPWHSGSWRIGFAVVQQVQAWVHNICACRQLCIQLVTYPTCRNLKTSQQQQQ
jgi:hypothetical protein